jgi:hypothetical protein
MENVYREVRTEALSKTDYVSVLKVNVPNIQEKIWKKCFVYLLF